MAIMDKNGVEIKTGDIIEISGRPVKNDNGRFLVTRSPGDPCWCGRDLSLSKMGKSGKLLKSNYNINSFPAYHESGEAVIIPCESAAAREYFTIEAEKICEQAETERRRGWCDQARYSELLNLADLYAETAVRTCSGKTYEKYALKQAAKAEAETGIKFYWNGIKVNGGKLIPCYFSMDNYHDGHEGVTIYVREYSGHLPTEYFTVINHSDSLTDYFEDDRAEVTPEHPLYKFVRYAAMKQAAHDAGKDSPAAAALSAAKNPGQPTAADLQAVADMRTAEETARRAEEHAARIAAREQALKERNEGRDYINKQAAAHPLRDGEPVVTIQWSEHPAFSAFPEGELRLSVAAAEIVLRHFDEAKHAEKRGYDKTSFRIDYHDPETDEPQTYEGRYDLGDNDGGLIAHIRAWGEYLQKEDTPAPMRNAGKGAETCAFADFLERFTASGKVVSVQFTPGIVDSMRGWKILKTGTPAEKKEFREWEKTLYAVDLLTDEQLQAAVMAVSHTDKDALDIVRFFCQQLAQRDRNKAINTFMRWKLGNPGA